MSLVRRWVSCVVPLALLVFGACGGGKAPRPLVVGEDDCHFCRMAITDARYGGEVRTAAGRLLTFDAVECMVGYVAAQPVAPQAGVWVADYETGSMVEAGEALFVLGGSLHSPMGRALTSFAPTVTPGELQARYQGEVLTWAQVLARQLAVPTTSSAATSHAPIIPGSQRGDAPEVEPGEIVVTPSGAPSPIADAIRRVAPGGRIRVRAGVYREPTIRIDRPLSLIGDAGAILDGSGAHTIVLVVADDVTVRGFTLRNTGTSQSDERAGVSVEDASGCNVSGNRFESTFFAVYLARARDCTVRDNVMRGPGRIQTASGNGVHVWSSERVQILGNDV
ncbi:MAG: nitrous oxide reductase accessory protein NosL, partial [Gemmatimonadota bacterium]